MAPPAPAGALAWMGLAAADRAAAVEFYVSAFDWQAADEADHTRLSRAGRDVAIVYQQTPQARAANVTSHWSPFFLVPDADRALERAAGSGGTSLRDPFNVKGGRVVPLQDHAGAVFSIWAPRGPDALEPIASDAWWIELSTFDVEASQAFYGRVLGWRYDESPPGATIRGAQGHIGSIRAVKARPAWSPCLRVRDLEEAGRGAKAAGAHSIGVIEHDTIGRTLRIVDPQGAALTLLEPA